MLRVRRRHLLQFLRYALVVLIIWTFVETASIKSALRQSARAVPRQLEDQKIFIASIHWNNEHILRTSWVPAVIDLVKDLGKEHVYVSIQESGSWDDSRGALRVLQAELQTLGVPHKVVLDETTHLVEVNRVVDESEPGWIRTPRGKLELRRIPYLSRLRNAVMAPLHQLREAGEEFDRVLWLNDVVFTTKDVHNLLATREGEYAAACSLDFSRPPDFYDTFALRDTEGHDAIMSTWPYFRASDSRRAMLSGAAVPVSSCWNGIVAMDAAPFYTSNLTFRGIEDSLALQHLEGSECCLIHADNLLSQARGVWLNPNVRVGYNRAAYEAVNTHQGLPVLAIARGLWVNRILRWFSSPWFKQRVVWQRLAAWAAGDTSRREPGAFCLINEMQVLVHNGWAHV